MKKQIKLWIPFIVILVISVFMTFVFAEEHSEIEEVSEDQFFVDSLEYDGEYYLLQPSNRIKVVLNGEELDFTDAEGNIVEPQIMNDRTMVPMRKIFEALGAEVEWNAEDRSIIATKDGFEIGLQIDNNVATITTDEGTNEITLDAAPVIVEGRTLVPVRFIAESLKKNVDWDEENRTVIINEIEENAEYYIYTPDEDEDLSETIYYDYWIEANMDESEF